MDLDSVSLGPRSVNTPKKNLVNIQPFWPHTWSITHTFYTIFLSFHERPRSAKNIWRIVNTIASIWREKMPMYLSWVIIRAKFKVLKSAYFPLRVICIACQAIFLGVRAPFYFGRGRWVTFLSKENTLCQIYERWNRDTNALKYSENKNVRNLKLL